VNIATLSHFDNTNLNNETGFFAKIKWRLWGILSSSTKVYSSVFENNSLYIGGNGGIDNSVTTCAYKRTVAGGYIGKISNQELNFGGSYTEV
jgi:hypothetical protein